ncbi:hypothetical protein Mtc_1927 [Methanocella conradii HZ254]|uniref:Uncharacterized protein n=1 Tax=Methanocella conradii (strain DSM 24694 / JCM 17849 / CGMCC 1.5162 / HZ254) TaxID=1041930 RepID=H8I4S2_METCZ|nr:hypothetical protein [Methanocella conradii]AFD00667.1 hypothetical protein Mtc_1927 [Methanocella conradii HZ254]
MSLAARLVASIIVASALIALVAPGLCIGTGVKAYVPTMRSATVEALPLTHSGSFMVYNDGYRDGVYIVRVGVTEPSSINWLNLSDSIFTLRPGQSKLVYFTFNLTVETAIAGEHEFIFTPTLLAIGVEPYLDALATYVSRADSFRFRLSISGQPGAASAAIPITFVEGNRTNFIQYSVLEDTNKVVTQLDRAIRLNLPDSAIVGEPVPVSISIFEGLSKRGISLMAVSPEGQAFPVSEGNIAFNSIGLWGVIVLVGDEMIIGRTIDVKPMWSPLAGLDASSLLAGLSLLLLLSVVPLWLLVPAKRQKDPYDDIVFKAYVVKKYIDKFDRDRLQRAVQLLKEEYERLVSAGAPGDKWSAINSIKELDALAELE